MEKKYNIAVAGTGDGVIIGTNPRKPLLTRVSRA